MRNVLIGLLLSVVAFGCSACDDPKAKTVVKTEYKTVFWDQSWNENTKDSILDGNTRVETTTFKSGRVLIIRCFKSRMENSKPRYDVRYVLSIPLLKRLGPELEKALPPDLVVAADGVTVGTLKARVVIDSDGISFLAHTSPEMIEKIVAAKKTIVAIPRQEGNPLDDPIEFGVGKLETHFKPVQAACTDAVGPEPPAPTPRYKTQEEIVAEATRVLEENPNDAQALTARGKAHLVENRYDQAIADLSKAIVQEPTLDDAWFSRGLAHKGKGQWSLAAEDFTKSLLLRPKNASAHLLRGESYDGAGEVDKALEDLLAATRLEPEVAGNWMTLGRVYFDKGDYRQAVEALSKSVEHEKSDQVLYPLLYRFIAYERLGAPGKPSLAEGLKSAKTKDWPHPVAEMFAGDRTVESVMARANKDPERCEAQFYVGQWQLLKGDQGKANEHFKLAAETCPIGFYEAQSAKAALRRMKP